jgi:membrane protein YqaA with SNARE-associated domain
MQTFIDWFLAVLAAPAVGLPAVFIISFVSATLLPMGSEPALFAYVKLAPQMFWPAICVATVGNTLGGALDWWMGYAARSAVLRFKHARRHARRAAGPGPAAAAIAPRAARPLSARHANRMRRLGPAVLLVAWLPVIGDPLCALAGWLRLPLGRCVAYMALGKFVRYIATTGFLLWVPDQFWAGVWTPIRALLQG